MQDATADSNCNPSSAYSLGKYFAHLTGDNGCIAVKVDDRFWEVGIAALPPGRLVSMFESDKNWSNWERHPEGEELIIQLDGKLDLILEYDGSVARILLSPGNFIIVPKGIWHTADVPQAGRALYITPGDGTESRLRID